MTEFSKTNKAQVWSCGGGTQSCAIAALIVQGKLPKPDFSVIADTGYETGATWEFMDRVLVPELKKVGVELVVVKAKEWAYHSNDIIHQNLKSKELAWRTPICGYSTMNGVSKMPNLCSSQWKQEPIQRWLSKIGCVTRSKYVTWIGFSRDEQRRIVKMQQCKDYSKGLIRFPLLEAGLTRRDCIKLVESMGWGTPPRSSCWMCPNHSDHEWRKLIEERPEEFQKAVELEREIHKTDPDAWLHRSCVPLDQVDLSEPPDLFGKIHNVITMESSGQITKEEAERRKKELLDDSENNRPCDSGMCFV